MPSAAQRMPLRRPVTPLTWGGRTGRKVGARLHGMDTDRIEMERGPTSRSRPGRRLAARQGGERHRVGRHQCERRQQGAERALHGVMHGRVLGIGGRGAGHGSGRLRRLGNSGGAVGADPQIALQEMLPEAVLGLVEVDQDITASVMEEISKLGSVKQAKLLTF